MVMGSRRLAPAPRAAGIVDDGCSTNATIHGTTHSPLGNRTSAAVGTRES